MQTGLQLYSIREETAQAFLPTLEAVAKMGYESVQFAGFYDASAGQVKQVLDANQLKVAGSHTMLEALQGEQYEETITYNKTIGNDVLICPYLDESYRDSKEAYLKTAKLLNEIGERCAADGLIFGYHHHDFEFEKFDGQTGFEILFENTDSAFVKIELDGYWATYAGYDPIDLIERYRERIISLHVKDMLGEGMARQSVELGKGRLAIKEMLQVAKSYGIDWAVVEQEHFNQPAMDSAAENIIALQKILSEIEGVNR